MSATTLLIAIIAMTKSTDSFSDFPGAPSANPPSGATAIVTMPLKASDDYAFLVNASLPEMPLLPITSNSTIRACRAMKVSPKDVFVCSYPKSGTTWTQNIVVRLLWEISGMNSRYKKHRPLPEDWHLSQSAPFYEVDQYWLPKEGEPESSVEPQPMERLPAQTPIKDDSNSEYRVFNTHLLPHQLPENARCVYVVRDPLDAMVSFYHHLSNQSVEDGGFTGSFDEFFEGFLDGSIVYGKWQNHIEAWMGRDVKNERKVLFLHYEDMKENLAKETKRLVKFLLDGNDESIVENDVKRYLDELVSRVVPHCTFKAMKEEHRRYTPLTVSWKNDPKTGKPYDAFVRKGAVGEGRKFLLEITSTTLRDRWVNKDVFIAKLRWKKAGVDQNIIDRYLL